MHFFVIFRVQKDALNWPCENGACCFCELSCDFRGSKMALAKTAHLFGDRKIGFFANFREFGASFFRENGASLPTCAVFAHVRVPKKMRRFRAIFCVFREIPGKKNPPKKTCENGASFCYRKRRIFHGANSPHLFSKSQKTVKKVISKKNSLLTKSLI